MVSSTVFQVGSFFMINLCLVVIATQFSETKQRESQLMKEQRVRFRSNASTLNSFSEPGSCYDELLKYLVHIIRKGTRQICHLIRVAGRRAGLRICASPPLEPPPTKRRRQKQRQESIRHVMHHQHHLHHHYHLGNGSVRTDGGREVDNGSQSGNVNNSGHLMLHVIVPHRDLFCGSLGPSGAESVHSVYQTAGHFEPLLCGPSPSPTVLQAYKRNSVPFAAPVHKNYPTLQSSLALEQLRQRILEPGGGSCTASVLTNLNIPPTPINTSQSLVETQGPPGKWILNWNSWNSTVGCVKHEFRVGLGGINKINKISNFILGLSNRLIMTNWIQNKSLGLHNVCVRTVYICIYKYTHIHVYI